MTIVNDGLEQELGHVSNPAELRHIRGLFDESDALMQLIAYDLITGQNVEVDRLTQEALGQGYSAETILDNGLIAGMAVVGIKFRDNIIFVPEVLVAARAMKAGMVYIDPILSASGIQPLGTVRGSGSMSRWTDWVRILGWRRKGANSTSAPGSAIDAWQASR